MKKTGWVLERKFSEKEIAEVKAFHEHRLAFAKSIQDAASIVTAELMIKYFTEAGEWVGVGHYEDEAAALGAVELLEMSQQGAAYRVVKATFPGASKGIWWGYEVVEEVKA